jgi:hypothetical protein
MGLKLTGCDCRQPGFPRHTHTHPLDANGQLIKDVQGLKDVQRRKWRHERSPEWLPTFWLVVIILLLLLKVWLEWHTSVDVEMP